MEYVYGSAAVIGLEMVPILGPLHTDAFEAAKKLGIAFQLANFIRDVDEEHKNLYLVEIDVSNYSDSQFNLKYPYIVRNYPKSQTFEFPFLNHYCSLIIIIIITTFSFSNFSEILK